MLGATDRGTEVGASPCQELTKETATATEPRVSTTLCRMKQGGLWGFLEEAPLFSPEGSGNPSRGITTPAKTSVIEQIFTEHPLSISLCLLDQHPL